MGTDTTTTAPPAPAAAPAPAPAAAPAPAPAAAPAPAPAPAAAPPPEAPAPAPAPPSFPSPDDFDWDGWKGDSFDGFADPVRPWVERATKPFAEKAKAAQAAAERARRLLEYHSTGTGEDPRVTEAEARAQAAEAQIEEYRQKIKQIETEVKAEREAENAQYAQWFEQTQKQAVMAAAQALGGDVDVTIDRMFDLSEKLNIEPHEALEVLTLGPKAAEEAMALSEGNRPEVVMQLIRLKHKQQAAPAAPAAPKAPPPEPKPAVGVVSGAGGPVEARVPATPKPKVSPKDTDAMVQNVVSKWFGGRG